VRVGAALATWVGVAGVLLPTGTRAQTDEQHAAARAAAKECLHAFAEGRYQEALDYCTRAESIMHAPTHVLLIARADAKLGHLVEAQEAYFRILRDPLAPDAPAAFAEAHQKAAEEQAALAPRVPTLRVQLQGGAPADVAVTIDGSPLPPALIDLASPVNPGTHALEAKGRRLKSEPVNVTIVEGAKETVTLALAQFAGGEAGTTTNVNESGTAATTEPSEPSRNNGSTRIAGWIGLAVGAAGVVAGTLFVVKNRSDRNDANALCAGGCPESRRADIASLDDSANSAATLAWISYGIGAAGVATGASLLWISATKPAARSSAGVHPWVGARSVGLMVAF
jgi:hypothetical protein